MRAFFFLLIISVGMTSLSASPLDDIRKNFQGKKSFSVQFTQEVKEDFFPDQKTQASGKIKFERPNQLEWKYEKPTARTIRYQKGKLTIEEKGEIDQLDGSDRVGVEESFSFLWGEASPKTLKIKVQSPTEFRVLPVNPPKAAFQWIDVEVKSGKVAQARVKNKLEGESLIHFSNWDFH